MTAYNYKYNRAIYGDLVYECESLREFIETATEDRFVQQELEDYDIFENQLIADSEVVESEDKIEFIIFGQVVTFRRVGDRTFEYESCTL